MQKSLEIGGRKEKYGRFNQNPTQRQCQCKSGGQRRGPTHVLKRTNQPSQNGALSRLCRGAKREVSHQRGGQSNLPRVRCNAVALEQKGLPENRKNRQQSAIPSIRHSQNLRRTRC